MLAITQQGASPLFVSAGECMVEMSPDEGDFYRLGYAGDSFNTAWTARQFLPETYAVRYLTAVGRDRTSDAMVSFIEGAGIDASHIIRYPDRTVGLYMVHLDRGERSFSYWRKDSAATRLADQRRVLDAAFEKASLIFVSGITLAILGEAARATLFGALQDAKQAGARIAFDPNYRKRLWSDTQTARVVLTKTARLADFVLPSYDDEAELFGDASPQATAERFLALGCSEVVVKDGPNPATVCFDGASHLVPAGAVSKVVDTTGAGDAFNGTYLAARMLDQSPLRAAPMAHDAARTVVQTPGALIPADRRDR